MTYAFPDSLSTLSNWLRRQGADVGSFKTERQATFMAQQLAGTRFKFPAKGASCFMVLQSIQKALSDGRSDKSASTDGRSVSDRRKAAKRSSQTAKVSRLRLDGSAAGWNVGLSIFCDGACEPNPGIGGWGFAVYRDGVEIHSDRGGDLDTTNNVMELTGALMALRWFAERGVIEPVRLLCDSQYVVKGCNEWRHGWKRNGWNKRKPNSPKRDIGEIKNLELWKELNEALTLVPIKLEWVKGHVGIVGNERADELSLLGRDAALALREPTVDDLIRQQLDYSVRTS